MTARVRSRSRPQDDAKNTGAASKLVYVRRQPNDDRTAAYRIEDIDGIHFSDVTGGVQIPLPYSVLCGYVWCHSMIEGVLAHSGAHGPCPHRIKVVIPKVCNDPRTWASLAGVEYREPKPLDMSPEAVRRRRDRALRAARTRTAKRAALVGSVASQISEKWPYGRVRVPGSVQIADLFHVPRAVARDARREAMNMRRNVYR